MSDPEGGRFLAHLHRAAMRRSPKINALVADLREALNKPGAAGKAVVFSQLRDALAHAETVSFWGVHSTRSSAFYSPELKKEKKEKKEAAHNCGSTSIRVGDFLYSCL